MDSDRLAEIRERAARGNASEMRACVREDVPDLLAEVDQLREVLLETKWMLESCRNEANLEIAKLRRQLEGVQ